jgi:hypothetical protein
MLIQFTLLLPKAPYYSAIESHIFFARQVLTAVGEVSLTFQKSGLWKTYKTQKLYGRDKILGFRALPSILSRNRSMCTIF